MRRTLVAAALAAALATALAGCGADRADDDRLQVLAAASLTEPFAELADEYEHSHRGVEVEVITASSTDLAQQAADGAPGDVLATADRVSMRLAVEGGATASEPRRFATNSLVIVTQPGNPQRIRRLPDLADVTWVRCADEAPCGRAAVAALDAADVTARSASLEPDVKAALERVLSGEADAGLVYSSDARAAGDEVETVRLGAGPAPNQYQIAPLAQSPSSEHADEWISLVTSRAGREILADAGFGPP